MIELKPYGFKQWKFPGGEVGVKLDPAWKTAGMNNPVTPKIIIRGKVNHDEIFVVLNLLDALDNARGLNNSILLTDLDFSYMPYGRQDRVCHEGESFALEVFVRTLATFEMLINRIVVDDPHSDVFYRLCEKYMPNVSVKVVPQDVCMVGLVKRGDFDLVVGPDAGSRGKATEAAIRLGTPVLLLSKVRKDGQVVYENLTPDMINGRVLIVDDIGDGMATFVSAGEMIRRTQPRVTKLHVHVTHGIFSRGLDHLVGTFDSVSTYNLMNPNVANHPLLAK